MDGSDKFDRVVVIADPSASSGSALGRVNFVFTRVWATLQLLFCCVVGVVVAVCFVVVGFYYFCMVLGGLTIGQLTASLRARKGMEPRGNQGNYVSHWWPSR
jgi:hypothetical protein